MQLGIEGINNSYTNIKQLKSERVTWTSFEVLDAFI